MENELGHINEDLLAKYLAGETNTAEEQQVLKWLEVEENRKEFEAFKSIWEFSADAELPQVDVDSAWEKVQSQINKESQDTPIRRLNSKADQPAVNWFLRIAAVLVPAVAIVLAVWQFSMNEVEQIVLASDSERIEQKLPDGSSIWLSPNSELTYPEEFSEANREVELTGEAFFEVARNEQQPFIIHTSQADVKVLGTSFNVNTFEQIEVIVESGKIAFYTEKKAEYVELKKGDKAVLQNDQKIVKSESVESDFYSRKTRTLVFDQTEMFKVAEVLQTIYRVNIDLSNEEIGSCRLTATFRDQEVNEILDVIAETFGLQIGQHENGFEINGTGCAVDS